MTATPRRARPFSRMARPAVDEEALVRRYQRDAWTVVQCARRFRISERHARDILDQHGVARRRRAAPRLDGAVVVAAYRKHQSVPFVAAALGTSRENVRALLDQAGEPHSRHVPLPGFATGQHRALAPYRAAPPVPPAPADLLTPSQAGRVLGVPPQMVRAAARTGQLDPARTPGGQRRYPRRQVTAFGQRRGAEARDSQ
jgi:hypothetical protein